MNIDEGSTKSCIQKVFWGYKSMKYEEKILIEATKLDNTCKSLIDYEKIDWDNLLRQGIYHKVLSFLYKLLEDDSNVPDYYMKILKSYYLYQKESGKIKIEEFNNVINLLINNNIKVVVLKGMYLAPQIYKDPGLRSFGDMDILIDKKDTIKAFEILSDLQYCQGEYDNKSDTIIKYEQSRINEYENELQHYAEFVKKSSTCLFPAYYIDVHHRLTTQIDDYYFNITDILNRAEKYKTNLVEAYRLSNEDFVLHLCSHLFWHTQSLQDIKNKEDICLILYSDIRLFIRNNDIDWNLLFEYANETKLTDALYYSLYHCQLIYNDVVPNNIFSKWDIEYLEKMSKIIYDRWIFRIPNMKIGEWKEDFLTRMFNEDRFDYALKSFYNDYIHKVLRRGGKFRIVETSDIDRYL